MEFAGMLHVSMKTPGLLGVGIQVQEVFAHVGVLFRENSTSKDTYSGWLFGAKTSPNLDKCLGAKYPVIIRGR